MKNKILKHLHKDYRLQIIHSTRAHGFEMKVVTY